MDKAYLPTCVTQQAELKLIYGLLNSFFFNSKGEFYGLQCLKSLRIIGFKSDSVNTN